MKNPARSRFLALCAVTAIAWNADAADVTKAPGGTDLTNGASWGGSVPASGDTAVWESTSLGAGLMLGSAGSWGGIEVNGALSDIDISGAGTLTLGAGGIDASASGVALSIGSDVVASGAQTWRPGTNLTFSGGISGSDVLTIDGESGTTLDYSSYLTESAVVVFPGASLASVTGANGLMDGAWVSGTNVPAQAYKFSNDGSTATFQLRFFDGGYTKCVKVELTQVGADIHGRALYAKYLLPRNTNDLGTDFDDTGNPDLRNSSVATNSGAQGYGAAATTVQVGTNTLVALDGVSSHSGGMIFNGGLVTGGAGVAVSQSQGGSFGAGNVTINAGATLVTTGTRVFGGSLTTRTVNINGGTLNIEVAGPGGEYFRTLNLSGGTLTADTASTYFRTPHGGADISSVAAAATSEITTWIDMTFGDLVFDVAEGGAADDLVLSGSVMENTGAGSGAKSVTKNGGGSMVMGGANTFTGGIAVTAGTLVINGDNSAATGDVTVSSGATLGGTATLGGLVDAVAGSVVAPGNPTGTLTAAGGSSVNGELAIRITGAAAGRLAVNGALDVSGLVIDFSVLSAPTLPSYVIVSASSLSGTPGTATGIPGGYQLNVNPGSVTLTSQSGALPSKAAMLFVHAHPDDEGIFGGGVLPYYSQVRGLPVAVVSMVTRNPDGSDPLTSGGTSRVNELRRAMDLYAGQALSSGALNGNEYQTGNIRHVVAGLTDTGCCSVPPDDSWSDAGDGYGWGTSSGVSQVTPGQGNLDGFADARGAAKWAIARQIRRFRPEVLVTCHDVEGDYGHSNHTSSAIAIIDAWTLAADAGTDIEGLSPWQAKKLYLRGGPNDNRNTVSYTFSDPTFPSSFSSDGGINPMFHEFFEDPVIGGQSARQVADVALDQHASQGSHDASTVFRSGEGFDGHHSEWWTLYRSVVGPDDIEPDFTVSGDTTGTSYTAWARGDFFNNLTIFPDSDDDGLADSWEIAHFSSLNADPGADDDGDGRDNLGEFIAGLDPNLRDLMDFSVTADHGAIDFSVPAADGVDAWIARRYRLVYSSDLDGWSTVITEGIADGTPLTYVIGDMGESGGRGFYRLEISIE